MCDKCTMNKAAVKFDKLLQSCNVTTHAMQCSELHCMECWHACTRLYKRYRALTSALCSSHHEMLSMTSWSMTLAADEYASYISFWLICCFYAA